MANPNLHFNEVPRWSHAHERLNSTTLDIPIIRDSQQSLLPVPPLYLHGTGSPNCTVIIHSSRRVWTSPASILIQMLPKCLCSSVSTQFVDSRPAHENCNYQSVISDVQRPANERLSLVRTLVWWSVSTHVLNSELTSGEQSCFFWSQVCAGNPPSYSLTLAFHSSKHLPYVTQDV